MMQRLKHWLCELTGHRFGRCTITTRWDDGELVTEAACYTCRTIEIRR